MTAKDSEIRVGRGRHLTLGKAREKVRRLELNRTLRDATFGRYHYT